MPVKYENLYGLVRQIDQCRHILTNNIGSCSAHLFHRSPFNPVGEVVRYFFLVETLPPDAVGETVYGERSAFEVRQHDSGDAAVILDKLPLGDAVIGEEDLVRPLKLDSPPAD
ncbi:MAG: hypothetical protein V1894_07290 [Chloroflexota bacterium]